MKRVLRNHNSCTAIQNIFIFGDVFQFPQLENLLPVQIINKLPSKKLILCEDIYKIKIIKKQTESELNRIKLATKFIKNQIQKELHIIDLNVSKQYKQNQYFDCILSQQFMNKQKKNDHMEESLEMIVNNQNIEQFMQNYQERYQKNQSYQSIQQELLNNQIIDFNSAQKISQPEIYYLINEKTINY